MVKRGEAEHLEPSLNKLVRCAFLLDGAITVMAVDQVAIAAAPDVSLFIALSRGAGTAAG
jgi:hypothetical protein